MDFKEPSPIGRNVARYRKAAGLSAAELAEMAQNGLTRSVIANLENGRKDDITVRQLMALSNALTVPPVALVADLFDPGAPSAYPIPGGSEDASNAELIQWVGGHNSRLVGSPAEAPAGKLVTDTLAVVRRYLSAGLQFRSTIKRYMAVRNVESDEAREEKDFLDQQVQHAAESVFDAMDAMRARGVRVAEDLPEWVHKWLGSIGKTYDPISIDDAPGAYTSPSPF